MADYTLGIIGAGNMAEAILRGWINSYPGSVNDIIASDISPGRRKAITDATGIKCTDNNLIPASCPVVILAVKPQVMGDVLDEIASTIGDDTHVISIAAGITSKFIDKKLNGKGRIVRVMPNTPMLVKTGMSAIATDGPRATEAELDWTEKVFGACGETVRVPENMIDAVIAVSGSGPAYFFYLVEAMIEGGKAEGLDEATAKLLAVQTFIGAAKLMDKPGETPSPEELRRRVTSPGGTTQAAIESMEADGVKQSLIKAMHACAARSRELGK